MSLPVLNLARSPLALACGLVAALTLSCGDDESATTTPTAPTPTPSPSPNVTSLTVEGPDGCSAGPTTLRMSTNHTISCVNAGESIQLTALATMSDGFTQDVTDEAVWSTSDPDQVRVDSNGLVTGAEPFGGGAANVRAIHEGVSAVWPVQAVNTIAQGVDVRGHWNSVLDPSAFAFDVGTFELTTAEFPDFLASGIWVLVKDEVVMDGQVDVAGGTGRTEGGTFFCTGDVTPPTTMTIVCVGELGSAVTYAKQ